jgi:hypothetical protein
MKSVETCVPSQSHDTPGSDHSYDFLIASKFVALLLFTRNGHSE